MARLRWQDLPGHIRAAAEHALGSQVVRDAPQAGGYSPGLASRLKLQDGRQVFSKAVNAARNPQSPALYRREIAVMEAFPDELPVPSLRWSYDDGDWVMRFIDDVDGSMPDVPWRPEQLTRVMAALDQLAERLTPSPIEAMSIVDDLDESFRSWSVLANDSELASRLGPWAQQHVSWLVELESGWARAAEGNTLLHTDLRADNLLLTAEDQVVVVDWPWAVTGAAWVDALMFLPSVAATSTVDPEQVWDCYPPARAADPEAVNAVLAAVAGDFLYQSLRPAPQNMPTLRAHQADRGAATLSWLQRRVS